MFRIKGILRYNKEDYLKNQWFANHLVCCAKEEGLELILLFEDQDIEEISFVVNRTRSIDVGEYYERQGIRVFNSSAVTRMGNDKKTMYESFNVLELPYLDVGKKEGKQEYVVKERYGHGGTGVFLTSDVKEVDEEFYVVQEYRKMKSDCRVIVLGNEILVGIRRENAFDFRHNISLGAKSSLFEVSKEMKDIIDCLCRVYSFDLVGIDLLEDEEGKLWINEIEDVVGVRSLYQHSSMDIAMLYIRYIKGCMNDKGSIV